MAFFLRLILRNLMRQRLRNGLTSLGVVVAIVAFGLLRTLVDAWYAGVEGTAPNRLITRNAVSLMFALPIHYGARIRQIDGVRVVSHITWFGGIYQDPKNFFPQFAIEPASYLALYREYLVSEQERAAFLRDRKGALAGRKLVERYGWKIGDTIPLEGTIYPGTWTFVLRGVYRGADAKTDETQFFFHWEYLNETLKRWRSARAEHVGAFVVGIDPPERAAEISAAIDDGFRNSRAETLTETEKAFQLGFVFMTEAIVAVIEIVSGVIIVIVLAVLANTMAMSVRERKREYATLKALGFGTWHLGGLIVGEALLISAIGGALGIALTFPIAAEFAVRLSNWFPIFRVSESTVVLAAGASLLVGILAAAFPVWQVWRTSVTDGLSSLG
ncbi:MAG TPA: ABC transporter permease [Methylococcus sp.]|nr:ABC transporter permease [Methylococcus sp.]